MRSIRLADNYVAALDAVAQWHTEMTGIPQSRAHAVEFMLIKLSLDKDTSPALRERVRAILDET